jgi:diguanylate cyclase (GGDEF)-like protein
MSEERVIQLGGDVIDLVDDREPTLADVARSSAVRRAAARALHELEANHDHAPWVVICTTTSEVIASSPSFDPSCPTDWRAQLEVGLRLQPDDVPLAVVGLGASHDVSADEPMVVAAQWIARALAEIVRAEQRAAVADVRAVRAEALAATDALTGLANQRAWWDRIAEEDARTRRSKASDVIAVVDLDDLKTVNDENGHLHGDLLLRLAAQTLRSAVRSCDVLARVGGDEFAVLAVDFEGEPAVLGERIAEALVAAGIRASIGVAAPSAGLSLVDAFDRADRAMYAHKRNRRRASADT